MRVLPLREEDGAAASSPRLLAAGGAGNSRISSDERPKTMRRADLGVRSMDFSMERRGVLRGLEMGVALLTGFLLFQTRSRKLISFL